MTDKPMKIPGLDHPISIEANPSRVVVTVGGKVIADTRAALTLREASYPAVQYIPRRDVDMAALARSEHTTYCPYKGDASCGFFICGFEGDFCMAINQFGVMRANGLEHVSQHLACRSSVSA
jgi:uncharacterized protein (DUF427 family)